MLFNILIFFLFYLNFYVIGKIFYILSILQEYIILIWKNINNIVILYCEYIKFNIININILGKFKILLI